MRRAAKEAIVDWQKQFPLIRDCETMAGSDRKKGEEDMHENTLMNLGLNEWIEERAGSMRGSGEKLARVMAVDRSAYVVRSDEGEIQAELSGKLRFETESTPDLPCVGDWVCIEQASPQLAIIHRVLPRRTSLRRKRPGKTVDFQMIASNLDFAFIIQSCHYDFNLRRLDRYLVAANEGNIEPVIVLTKTDLITPEELNSLTTEITANGITAPLLPISNITGAGLDELRALLMPAKTYCLLGSSGVGKTTLINRLTKNDALITKEVSDTGEGVHTTSRRQLLILDNGAMLIDTPGMRELGLLDSEAGIADSFPEITSLTSLCRFADCTHTQEPGCAVLSALADGEISQDRYESYFKLKKESEFHDMSYAEKRRKDRDLGHFYKSVMKDKRRYRDK